MSQEKTALCEQVEKEKIDFDTSRYSHMCDEEKFIEYATGLRKKIEDAFPGGIESTSGSKRTSTRELRVEYLLEQTLITMIRSVYDNDGKYNPQFYVEVEKRPRYGIIYDKIRELK